MRTGKYQLGSFLENNSVDQFVVPEIQRDYVWGINDLSDFLAYIKEGFQGGEGERPYIGFIYAYSYQAAPRKYILIDGQQRMTTVFLLLILCYMRAGKQLPRFLLDSGTMKLDYKVREQTHDFLRDLVAFCDSRPELYNFVIEDQYWYHTSYENDRTIANLIKNFEFIRTWLSGISMEDHSKFVAFLEDEVELSYFDIRESEQGEDLYLYMNSRGRPLVTNETLKAFFLAPCGDKNAKGAQWESWQDFFWQHKKSDSENADAGFNDFLRMVQIITMAGRGDSNEVIANFASGKSEIKEATFEDLPNDFDALSAYFESFKWMVEQPDIAAFYSGYESPGYLTSPKPAERRQLFYFTVLPILAFINFTGCRDVETVLRFIRFFYNLSRKSQTVGKDISSNLPMATKLMIEYSGSKTDGFDVTDLTGYASQRTRLINEEELMKLKIFNNPPEGMEREAVEEIFWVAEDHWIFQGEIEFLLNASMDKKSMTFSFPFFEKSWNVFREIFQSEHGEYKQLLTALILHGNPSIQVSPYYYQNYDYAYWYWIVRSYRKESLLQVIRKLHDRPLTDLDVIIRERAKVIFSAHYSSVEDLKRESVFSQQVMILALIDYFTLGLMFEKGIYTVSKDVRFNYGNHTFFDDKFQIFNVKRYISDGGSGNLMHLMKPILGNDENLEAVLWLIKNG